MREKNLNKGSVNDDDDESSGKLILFLFQRQNYQNQITQNVFFVNFSGGNIRGGCCSTGTGFVLPVHRGPHRE